MGRKLTYAAQARQRFYLWKKLAWLAAWIGVADVVAMLAEPRYWVLTAVAGLLVIGFIVRVVMPSVARSMSWHTDHAVSERVIMNAVPVEQRYGMLYTWLHRKNMG